MGEEQCDKKVLFGYNAGSDSYYLNLFERSSVGVITTHTHHRLTFDGLVSKLTDLIADYPTEYFFVLQAPPTEEIAYERRTILERLVKINNKFANFSKQVRNNIKHYLR
jgi:hypothetical protein